MHRLTFVEEPVANGKSPNLLYAVELDQRFSRQIAERVLLSQFAALAF